MANKKINELSVRTPSLSDLMLVGDPSTGYSYKATISSLSTLLEANIALNDLSDVVITSVANGNLLAYNGTNWVNRTLGAYLGGTITQYVRGDGSLGDFAGGGGGGGASVSYYLNGSVNQGTFSGNTYYEMNKSAIIGAGTDFSINANGYIASFITDAGDPALLKIPGGNWNLEFYFSSSSAGGTPSFYVELYKYNGTTFTLIASNSTSPEGITGGTAIDAYFTSLSVPETVLTLTDRLAIRVYVTHSGRTITLHTENSHLCQIITTFTTGLTALNNLTAQVQFFATGTSGTDFAISSTTATHTFNLPTASGSNRGALSSADWTTFNSKIGGSGTTNYVSKFTASGTIGNSQIFDNGTSVGVNTASPSASYKFDVNGTARIQGGSSVPLTSLTSNFDVANFFGSAAYAGFRIVAPTSGGSVPYIGLNTSSNVAGYNVGLQKAFFAYWGDIVNYASIGYGSGSHAMVYSVVSGNVIFGGGTTDAGYKVDIGGTLRASGDANINGLTVGKGGGSVATSTAIGFEAMNSTVTGAGNVAVGYRAGKAITSGLYNAFVGYEAGTSVNTGSYNYGFGMWAGRYLTSGVQNVLIGYSAGAALTTQNNNVFIGHSAGDATTAGNNVGIGFQTMQGNTTGTANTTLGTVAGKGITTGSSNSVIGDAAGFAIATGSSNVLLGRYAGYSLTSSTNTAIGAESLFSLTTGANNTALGYIAGRYITAGTGNITSANSVYLGYDTRASADGNTNEIVIGYQSRGNGSNSVTLGNTSVTKTILQGNVLIGTTTDLGYKLDVNGTARIQGATTISTGRLTISNAGNDFYPLYIGSSSVSNSRIYLESSGLQDIVASGGPGLRFQSGSLRIDGTNNTTNKVFISTANGVSQHVVFWLNAGETEIGGTGGVLPTSAMLSVTSTTKGFLPPRMTGAQAEAIGTPAAGLMVYSTDGSGATITSLGWWGYNGTTWVKLN
jgi:hypothetical protein